MNHNTRKKFEYNNHRQLKYNIIIFLNFIIINNYLLKNYFTFV